MTDDTDERGEEYVARQRGGDERPQHVDTCRVYNCYGCEEIADDPVRGGDHLPECPMTGPMGYLCICTLLRACEARVERVTREDDNRALWDNRQWNAALDAARDAVAAAYSDDHKDDWGVQVLYDYEAIAAIDALRGAE